MQSKGTIEPMRAKCPTEEQLRALLEESLDAESDRAVALHLEDCTACQLALEAAAGERQWWDEAHSFLSSVQRTTLSGDPRDDSLHPVASREADIAAEIEKWLGPSDDPASLGRIGPYEVTGVVGAGSMGVVLKAHEPRLKRFVAIKVLLPLLAHNGAARKRFFREARSAAAVSHPHVVPIYGVDEYQGLPYLVMQYVPGQSLAERIAKEGSLSVEEVVRIGMQTARALAAAHEQGLVHRDIKPANILLENGIERVLVTDFGLARIADDASMTRSGVIAGTPQFMSPEQASGRSVGTTSDLFSLGGVMYAMCTGHPPFRSASVFGLLKRICEDAPRSIRASNPLVPPWLERFILKLLAKDARGRFSSAAHVADLLTGELAFLQNPTAVVTPERPWLAKSRRLSPWLSRLGEPVFAVAGIAICMALLFLPPQVVVDPPGAQRAIAVNEGVAWQAEQSALHVLAAEIEQLEAKSRPIATGPYVDPWTKEADSLRAAIKQLEDQRTSLEF